MYHFVLSLLFACLTTCTAYSQPAKFDIKYQKETVLVDGKPFCLLKTSEKLPISYSIHALDGSELVTMKVNFIKIETGKREGFFLVTFTETGQTVECEVVPSFGRVFLQELIETETLTIGGINVENERRFVRKSKLRLSETIKAKVKND